MPELLHPKRGEVIRRYTKEAIFAILIFLANGSFCLGQVKGIPVAVSHSGDDKVGGSVASSLKETIGVSKRFSLIPDRVKTPRIVVHLISMAVSNGEQEQQIRTGMAVVIVYESPQTVGRGVYLRSAVLTCGADQVETCAGDILPVIERAVEQMQTTLPELWQTLQNQK